MSIVLWYTLKGVEMLTKLIGFFSIAGLAMLLTIHPNTHRYEDAVKVAQKQNALMDCIASTRLDCDTLPK